MDIQRYVRKEVAEPPPKKCFIKCDFSLKSDISPVRQRQIKPHLIRVKQLMHTHTYVAQEPIATLPSSGTTGTARRQLNPQRHTKVRLIEDKQIKG